LPVRSLAVGDFFDALTVATLPRLPVELRAFETMRGRGRLLKLYYDRPEMHFEIWHHFGAGRLEIGLHFEAQPARNATALEFFRTRMVEVKASLPRAELEPWDKGWTRLYETLSAPALDHSLVVQAATLLAAYVIALQPMLQDFLIREGGSPKHGSA